MEYMRIKTITEGGFDQVVISAGGSRILEEGSADYRLNEAIVELKLVSEEGFEKTERQKKLADLFREAQPNRPIVVINPTRLNESDSRSYYRIVEVPIKNACKKASKQLQTTAERESKPPVRVLVILNIGYTLLSPDEFKDVCLKCVRNDTSGIDWVICGGIYIYSDKAENFVIARFEDFPINLTRSFPSHEALGEAWGKYLNKLMMEAIRNPLPFSDGRMPVVDLMFELDGIRYVKTAPTMSKSGFWPGGIAPRENTSGVTSCPQVARTFPALSKHDWNCFKEAMPFAGRLKATYQEWVESYPKEEPKSTEPLKPIVLVDVKFEEFDRSVEKLKAQWNFRDVCEFANEVFYQRGLSLLKEAKEKNKIRIVPLYYIHLIVNEVGTDKVNDFASIYYVSELPGFERNELLVENEKLFYEHGMAVATAYAIKHKVDTILFTKKRI